MTRCQRRGSCNCWLLQPRQTITSYAYSPIYICTKRTEKGKETLGEWIELLFLLPSSFTFKYYTRYIYTKEHEESSWHPQLLMNASKLRGRQTQTKTRCCAKKNYRHQPGMMLLKNVKLRIAVSTQRWSMETARPGTSSPEAGVQPRAHTRLLRQWESGGMERRLISAPENA